MRAYPGVPYLLRFDLFTSCSRIFATVILLFIAGCDTQQTLVTIADARSHPAQLIDSGDSGDSAGDMLDFDHTLLDSDIQTNVNNSVTCIPTRQAHSKQCQRTFILPKCRITIAGREFDTGTSMLSIVGGTGDYAGISGELQSTNNTDGTFTQILRYR